MKRTGLLIGVLFTLAATIGLVAQSAQELYQRALVEEQATGNLTQAIALYAQAAQSAGKDRALAAKALMRMAGAQEKVGAAAEAEKSYAALLRAYPEQRAEVTVAQQRLAALRRERRVDAAIQPAVTADRAPDTELAARLSALIWSAAPDATLLEAARRGDLHDPRLLQRQVGRMLRDQKSNALVDNFFVQWLSLDGLKSGRSKYPQADDELLQAMQTETRLFLQSQLREDRDAVELWTANYTYVNDRLAGHYGLSGSSGTQFRRVTWPDTNRAGILGQAGLLTVLSFPERTSPTLRGTYLLNRFLGENVPQPPSNVPALEERLGSQSGAMRGRMIAHRTHASCAACHVIFDPFGLALENFDAVGRWRDSDGGAPIDASGSLADGTKFSGPAELRAALLKRRDAYYTNVTEQLLSYALNRKGRSGRVYPYEMPAVRRIVREASADGHRWSSILAGITASEPFQKKSIVP
jgi:tetratricopeptide (TPR) repeat protein